MSHLAGTFQIVECPCGDASKNHFLSSPASQQCTHLVEQLFLSGELPLLWQIPCSSQRLSTRHDGNLDQRIGILQHPAHSGVSSLMISNGHFLLSGRNLVFLLQTTNDSVDCIEEVLFLHRFLIAPGSDKSRLIADIGNVGTREARSLTRHKVHIYAVVHLDRAEMHLKYFLAVVHIRQIDTNLTVETARTKQGFVQNINTVGSRQNDDTTIRAETIHFGKQLIERIFTFIVCPHIRVFATGTAHRINLIDKYDARSFLLSLSEEVTHTRGTYSHKHLHEIRTSHREERHIGLTRHSLGKKSLAGTRRAHQQRTLRYFTTQIGIMLRILQERNNLLDFFLGLTQSGHILESNLIFGILLIENLRAGLADTKNAATAASASATHAAHHHHPENNQQNDRAEAPKEVLKIVVLLFKFDSEIGIILLLPLAQLFGQLVGRRNLHRHIRSLTVFGGIRTKSVTDLRGLDFDGCGILVANHIYLLYCLFLYQCRDVVPAYFLGRRRRISKVEDNQEYCDGAIYPIEILARKTGGLVFVCHIFLKI